MKHFAIPLSLLFLSLYSFAYENSAAKFSPLIEGGYAPVWASDLDNFLESFDVDESKSLVRGEYESRSEFEQRLREEKQKNWKGEKPSKIALICKLDLSNDYIHYYNDDEEFRIRVYRGGLRPEAISGPYIIPNMFDVEYFIERSSLQEILGIPDSSSVRFSRNYFDSVRPNSSDEKKTTGKNGKELVIGKTSVIGGVEKSIYERYYKGHGMTSYSECFTIYLASQAYKARKLAAECDSVIWVFYGDVNDKRLKKISMIQVDSGETLMEIGSI